MSNRRLLLVFLTSLLLFPLTANSELLLTQVNPTAKAGSPINLGTTMDEYPWFSTDGKMMLWTRQQQSGCSGICPQELYVTYLKNYDTIRNKNKGQTLPALSVAYPAPIYDVNNCINGQLESEPWCTIHQDLPLGAEVKALAYCETSIQPGAGNKYTFNLFLAAKDPNSDDPPTHMYRADGVWVDFDSQGNIEGTGINGSIFPIIPQRPSPSGNDFANETEPMLTRDGNYLFWASDEFNFSGTYAKYIFTGTKCAQANQTPVLYSALPTTNFAWKDQFTTGQTYQKTRFTNYHTVIERNDGKTALIFEQCVGQATCNQSQQGNRQCLCDDLEGNLSTTGFAGASVPYAICNGAYSDSGTGVGGKLNLTGHRVTHPTIAGPRGSKGWLLFYMRGKDIWYTKVDEETDPSCPQPGW